MQWAPDLIGYDSLSSYGSPSYWTQVMFSTHSEPKSSLLRSPNAALARLRLPSHATMQTHKLFRQSRQRKLRPPSPLRLNSQASKRSQSQADAHNHERAKLPTRTNKHHASRHCRSGHSHGRSSGAQNITQTFAPYSGERAGIELLDSAFREALSLGPRFPPSAPSHLKGKSYR